MDDDDEEEEELHYGSRIAIEIIIRCCYLFVGNRTTVRIDQGSRV